ncbi:hypothetical protein L202_08319 [Cryptococcus amylolentus CBS 6039]|uniref:Aminoglycoside phosphotransferase domain-containing protein n=1 Tax=Cryptococcus amylolentus CBS 6039 TaxID=1295533 RepID=A0A1E3HAU8_9TREE|nr:hypothetical protein L202_08319 [Cryptococcus amylolentus CBS 6039]ODN72896.1 hypothetical protein L202_08319 [Cryptococcus amylolentus CBS 6039]
MEKDQDRYTATLLEFAQHYIAVADIKLEVKGIGSLYPFDNSCGYTLGPITSMGTFMRPEPPYFLGPFKTLKERYVAHIDQALFHIRSTSFFMLYPIQVYLWLLELLDMIAECEVLAREEEEIYIRHADDWFRQSMRDSEGHLTGCLDWEAYATTKAEAFSSLLHLHLKEAWDEGDNALNSGELLMIGCFGKLGRSDLGECIRNGRLYARLEEALRVDQDLLGYINRRGNVNGLLDAFRARGQEVPGPFESNEEMKAWIGSLEKKREDNGELDEVRSAWEEYDNARRGVDAKFEGIMDAVIEEEYKRLGLMEEDGVTVSD